MTRRAASSAAAGHDNADWRGTSQDEGERQESSSTAGRQDRDDDLTATSRRDATDTYKRYVNAQIRKGRDADEVEQEGRLKADEKRVKNRDYARNKLATGKARVNELEERAVQLKSGNDALADEIRSLEAQLAESTEAP